MDSDIATRVARRFLAARAINPERLQALLAKLRKGSGWSQQIKTLLPVFEHLGGWGIEPCMLLVTEYGSTDGWMTYQGPHVQVDWDRAKKGEVSKLPDPARLTRSALGTRYYLNVSPIEGGKFTCEQWFATAGVQVMAPNRALFKYVGDSSGFVAQYPSLARDVSGIKFDVWLKTETPFLKQINDVLGTEPYEVERERVERERQENRIREEHLGTCPACFGHFKIYPGTKNGKDRSMYGMVLHGYKRPGFGQIHGRCFGINWPPFEQSPEGTVAFINNLEGILEYQRQYLESMKRDEITVVEVFHHTFEKSKLKPQEWAVKLQQATER